MTTIKLSFVLLFFSTLAMCSDYSFSESESNDYSSSTTSDDDTIADDSNSDTEILIDSDEYHRPPVRAERPASVDTYQTIRIKNIVVEFDEKKKEIKISDGQIASRGSWLLGMTFVDGAIKYIVSEDFGYLYIHGNLVKTITFNKKKARNKRYK